MLSGILLRVAQALAIAGVGKLRFAPLNKDWLDFLTGLATKFPL